MHANNVTISYLRKIFCPSITSLYIRNQYMEVYNIYANNATSKQLGKIVKQCIVIQYIRGELIHARNLVSTQQLTIKGHLVRNKKSNHGGIKYQCNQCDYQATREDYLTVHQKAGHLPTKPVGRGQP